MAQSGGRPPFQKLRILGIDPGSRLTGYGCIDMLGTQIHHVTDGTLKIAKTSGRATMPLEERLYSIYLGLSEIIREHRPDVLSVEKVFFAKNAVSALKLGQARGAAILTGMIHAVSVVEYSPSEVKLSVVGHGHADKHQVARIVQLVIGGSRGKQAFTSLDASDGLALALCHAYRVRDAQRAAAVGKNNLSALQSASGRSKKKNLSLAEALGLVGPLKPAK